MRKGLIIVLSLALLLSSCATSTGGDSSTISVSGTSTVYMEADSASFTVSAEAVKETTEEARNTIDGIITEAVNILKEKYGVKTEDIKTNYLSLSPEYAYVDNQRVLTGQRGYQSIDVSLDDITIIGSIVEDLSKINGISISSITLDKADKSAQIAEARRLAVEDAMEKASTYAAAVGKTVTDVVSISDGSSPMPKVNSLRLEAAAFAPVADDASYSTTLYSYDLSCSDSVNLVVTID